MRVNWPTVLRAVFVSGNLLWCTACTPVPDPSLFPPIVGKPLYGCAEVISFSGAGPESTIVVYVNGSQEARQNTWLGWGTVRLPKPLTIGDVVTAAQKAGGRLSYPTRDPVTVATIPTALIPNNRKLRPPKIVSPLYECQRVVRVGKVLSGAKVELRDKQADAWKGMTPYTVHRQGTPALGVPDDSFSARQHICGDRRYGSTWSAGEPVQQKPPWLPRAIPRQPLVIGSDACVVDNLVPGATVKIIADDGTHQPVEVGGGTAVEASTIFRIQPRIASGYRYSATQALCELTSIPGAPITPVPSPPAPSIRPICAGEYHVVICDTVVQSTINILIGGVQIAHDGAGNGGCVKLALGGKKVFAAGDSVTARQEVAGNATTSAAVTVKVDGAPPYTAAYWNHPSHVRKNNCYNYACNQRTDTNTRVGSLTFGSSLDCSRVGQEAEKDGLVRAVEKKCRGCTHKVALFIGKMKVTLKGKPFEFDDYHWYRLDDTGRWSHKSAKRPATDLDASDKPITNPETADRTYVRDYTLNYDTFCGYYCVDKDLVVIQ